MAGKLNCPSLHFYLVNTTNITYEVGCVFADAQPVVAGADILSNLVTISRSTMAVCKDGLLLSGLGTENISLTVVVVWSPILQDIFPSLLPEVVLVQLGLIKWRPTLRVVRTL